jgi:hypothetical protein
VDRKVGKNYCLQSFVKRCDGQRLLWIARSRWEYKVKRKFKVMDECGLRQRSVLGSVLQVLKIKCGEYRD